MKNTTNWKCRFISSSIQIFHALTWQRKTATAARREVVRRRREYDGDEVEAAKLFLTGDDGVAAALGFEELERESSDRAE